MRQFTNVSTPLLQERAYISTFLYLLEVAERRQYNHCTYSLNTNLIFSDLSASFTYMIEYLLGSHKLNCLAMVRLYRHLHPPSTLQTSATAPQSECQDEKVLWFRMRESVLISHILRLKLYLDTVRGNIKLKRTTILGFTHCSVDFCGTYSEN